MLPGLTVQYEDRPRVRLDAYKVIFALSFAPVSSATKGGVNKEEENAGIHIKHAWNIVVLKSAQFEMERKNSLDYTNLYVDLNKNWTAC